MTPEPAAALAERLQEIVAAKLAHSSIAAPIVGGVEDYIAFLVHEYLPADSLDVVLRRSGRLGVSQALGIVQQAASALDAAADKGMLHGALHPRDILSSAG